MRHGRLCARSPSSRRRLACWLAGGVMRSRVETKQSAKSPHEMTPYPIIARCQPAAGSLPPSAFYGER